MSISMSCGEDERMALLVSGSRHGSARELFQAAESAGEDGELDDDQNVNEEEDEDSGSDSPYYGLASSGGDTALSSSPDPSSDLKRAVLRERLNVVSTSANKTDSAMSDNGSISLSTGTCCCQDTATDHTMTETEVSDDDTSHYHSQAESVPPLQEGSFTEREREREAVPHIVMNNVTLPPHRSRDHPICVQCGGQRLPRASELKNTWESFRETVSSVFSLSLFLSAIPVLGPVLYKMGVVKVKKHDQVHDQSFFYRVTHHFLQRRSHDD